MLSFQTRYAETDDPREKKICRRHITELDGRIDAVVYELYRITPDEILIAERDMAGKEQSC